ncbi:hypothetical protein CVS30_03785 [Arthrobacter psychrolactophilus]|uniref:Uncharacterized protein n=1 Tax=Arthrobacter psychrolactophilus TaxID=92442 RepID=A0A2V5J9A2_9MICC|nr:hypothetical protein [Arthrobacter psychrolactophilus]PYI39790.1 hypothetical protein CVS30_03785 [Arthrobacter psychrolactophilus]
MGNSSNNGFYMIGTKVCLSGHNHTLPRSSKEVAPGVTVYRSPNAVYNTTEKAGRMVRRFGNIVYWPATGHRHITINAGATRDEILCLYATAKLAREDWPIHPCEPDRRRVQLCRYVDDDYLAQAEAAMFQDLELTNLFDLTTEQMETV